MYLVRMQLFSVKAVWFVSGYHFGLLIIEISLTSSEFQFFHEEQTVQTIFLQVCVSTQTCYIHHFDIVFHKHFGTYSTNTYLSHLTV